MLIVNQGQIVHWLIPFVMIQMDCFEVQSISHRYIYSFSIALMTSYDLQNSRDSFKLLTDCGSSLYLVVSFQLQVQICSGHLYSYFVWFSIANGTYLYEPLIRWLIIQLTLPICKAISIAHMSRLMLASWSCSKTHEWTIICRYIFAFDYLFCWINDWWMMSRSFYALCNLPHYTIIKLIRPLKMF